VILGIDTATPATVAAVLRPDDQVFEARQDPAPGTRPGHATLLALVEQALREAGAAWTEVERIAVGVGPGGFTGLRIGIATARALAQGHGLPLVPVSSLDALAASAGDGAVPVIDARRGEVFSLPAGAYAPDALAARLPAQSLLAGDGAVAYADLFTAAGHRLAADHRLRGGAVCRLGASAAPRAPRDVLPDYRRDPDAVPPSRP
jgi:tRNA threonylcarbamoyladenosine biosynthesis protein TsaB